MNELILASGSPYRKTQLLQLQLDFTAVSPDVDESAAVGELPSDLALRLATAKALKVKTFHSESVIIGSDQVCACDNQAFGKPHTASRAIEQLSFFSNKCVEFFTALTVVTADGQLLQHVDVTSVEFRLLQGDEIIRYVDKEQPLDCAGSFKIEALGSSLFKAVNSSDPSALMGLPLIKLCEFLRFSSVRLP